MNPSRTGNERVITSVDQLTPAWLTEVLVGSGALEAGCVASFEIAGDRGNWSTNARLQLAYSADARGARPERLFLKMVETDLGDESFGPSEVDYYTRDYVDQPGAPLLRCYHGAYDEGQQHYHLLLQDVTDTHIRASEKDPDLDYGLALAEGLAALHARWWGPQGLEESGAKLHNPGHIRRFIEIAEPGAGHILDRYAGQFAPHWPALLRDLFEQLPGVLVARSKDPDGLTLIHGDVGAANVLVPRDGVRPLYIIDRQPFDWSLTVWLGAYDLAYAIVLDWPVEARRRFEIPVLRHYHQRLRQGGVRDYAWERLWDDYRRCVAMCAYIAVEYCRGGINERWISLVLTYLRRSLTACDDLDCGELWALAR